MDELNKLFQTYFGSHCDNSRCEETNYFHNRQKNFRNKLDILSGHYSDSKYVACLERIIEYAYDAGYKDTLDLIDEGIDKELEKVV